MPDEIKDTAPVSNPEPAPESVDATPDTPSEGTPPEISDPKALLSAFERQKQANAELKAKMAEYDKLLNTVAESVGGVDPAKGKADQSALKALNEFQLQQRLDQIRQEAASSKERELTARHQKQIEQERQRYTEALKQAETMKLELENFQKRTRISALFSEVGGEGADFDNFYALMASRIEWEGDVPVGILENGSPVLDDSTGKKLPPEDYFALVRQGRKGTPMLQSAFKPWNQSQGSGIGKQPLSTSAAGRRTFPRAQMGDVLQELANRGLSEEQMKTELNNINWV